MRQRHVKDLAIDQNIILIHKSCMEAMNSYHKPITSVSRNQHRKVDTDGVKPIVHTFRLIGVKPKNSPELETAEEGYPHDVLPEQ